MLRAREISASSSATCPWLAARGARDHSRPPEHWQHPAVESFQGRVFGARPEEHGEGGVEVDEAGVAEVCCGVDVRAVDQQGRGHGLPFQIAVISALALEEGEARQASDDQVPGEAIGAEKLRDQRHGVGVAGLGGALQPLLPRQEAACGHGPFAADGRRDPRVGEVAQGIALRAARHDVRRACRALLRRRNHPGQAAAAGRDLDRAIG